MSGDAKRDEWGVISPEGSMWVFKHEGVARAIALKGQRHLHHRTVTLSAWERVSQTGADSESAEKDTDVYRGHQTKPNPEQPDRCPSIDPYDTLQCGRRIHEDDQCQFGGIGWKKGTRPPHDARVPGESA